MRTIEEIHALESSQESWRLLLDFGGLFLYIRVKIYCFLINFIKSDFSKIL
jgi:hypothetical protein